jgi:hypothetical protein
LDEGYVFSAVPPKFPLVERAAYRNITAPAAAIEWHAGIFAPDAVFVAELTDDFNSLVPEKSLSPGTFLSDGSDACLLLPIIASYTFIYDNILYEKSCQGQVNSFQTRDNKHPGYSPFLSGDFMQSSFHCFKVTLNSPATFAGSCGM